MTEAEFAELAERHRRELHVHCYRMLGSFQEAEDLVQETMLRAWRARDTLGRDDRFRPWLYKIATNACLDAIKRSGRRVPSLGSMRDVPWLQPYPDRLLDQAAPAGEEPDAAVAGRETIELTFLAVIQLLPPRQRAVLILREVLEWPAAEVAELLEIGVAAVNSALQRARETLRRHLPPGRREDWALPEASEAERELLELFIDAHERGDGEAALAAISEDVRITMPPLPAALRGARGGRGAARARLRAGAPRRVAARAHARESPARGGELPTGARRRHVPRVQARRPARRRRQDRRDHDVRREPVRGVRAAGDAGLATATPCRSAARRGC